MNDDKARTSNTKSYNDDLDDRGYNRTTNYDRGRNDSISKNRSGLLLDERKS